MPEIDVFDGQYTIIPPAGKHVKVTFSGGGELKIVGGVLRFDSGLVGLQYDAAAPTAYAGADAPGKAIDPAIAVAALTKATAGTDYTLAAPGAANINKTILVYSTAAAAHVVTVTGLAGGTTMTFAAAIGSSFMLYAISATAWSVVTKNGVTQT